MLQKIKLEYILSNVGCKQNSCSGNKYFSSGIFIVYPTYLQNEFKRRKANIIQTENATGLERGVSFFGVYFSKHDM